jgi:multicomponent K+:H+ antiporter subunit A
MLVALLLLPFLGSILSVLFLRTASRRLPAGLAGSVVLLSLLLTASLYPQVSDGGVVRFRAQWLPQLGLDLTLRMDGFSWIFSMLITSIGLLVILYARYYMSEEDPVPRFFSFLLAFMGAMLGIVIQEM